MRFLKWNLVPALFFAWYLAICGTTLSFFGSSMSYRITLQAPLEIVVPETAALHLRQPVRDQIGGSRVLPREASGRCVKGHAPALPGCRAT